MEYPFVTKDDDGIRPAGSPVHCFYCNAAVGERHRQGCVTISKLVRIKATIEIEIEVPHDWSKEQIEFRYNESTWCASNLSNDIERYKNATGSCMCGETKIELLKVVDDTPMSVPDSKLRTQKD